MTYLIIGITCLYYNMFICMNGIRSGIVTDLELSTFASRDLTDWVNSLRANPKLLHYFWLRYYGPTQMN